MFLLSTYLRIKVISRVKLTYTLLYAKWSKTSHHQCFNSLRDYPQVARRRLIRVYMDIPEVGLFYG